MALFFEQRENKGLKGDGSVSIHNPCSSIVVSAMRRQFTLNCLPTNTTTYNHRDESLEIHQFISEAVG